MGKLFPTAGSKIFIGGALTYNGTDWVAADFASQSWVEIGGTTNLGSAGDTAALITSDQVSYARTRKAKGTRNAGQMQVVSDLDYTDAGQLAVIAAEKTTSTYAFRVQFNDAPAVKAATVTVTIASPGVFTWTAHGLSVGDAVKFTTTGALPTGITGGTTYYVKTAPDADTFTIAATAGGTAIVTTGSQSGVHTGQTAPTPSMRYFTALVMGASEQLNAANNQMALNSTLEIDSNVVRVSAAQ